jgi:hypothetical protein
MSFDPKDLTNKPPVLPPKTKPKRRRRPIRYQQDIAIHYDIAAENERIYLEDGGFRPYHGPLPLKDHWWERGPSGDRLQPASRAHAIMMVRKRKGEL